MCTILTVNRRFYNDHKEEFLQQIRHDAMTNSEGYSLLMLSKKKDDSTLVRTMDSEVIIAMIQMQFDSDAAERVWVHCRMATTSFVGLNGCHGFAGKNFTVFHNGILQRPAASKFNVDSELIAHDIEMNGFRHAIDNLRYDRYANVFIVNNETGQYYVVRRSQGSLYTDGKGNYSTNKVAGIDRAVGQNTLTEHKSKIIPTPKVSKGYGRYGYGEWSDYDYSVRGYPKSATGNGGTTTSTSSGGTSVGNPAASATALAVAQAAACALADQEMTDEASHMDSIARESVAQDARDFRAAGGYKPKANVVDPDDVETDLEFQVDAVRWARNEEDFAAMAEFESWGTQGMPQAVKEALNLEQIRWSEKLGLVVVPNPASVAKASA